MDTGVIEPRGFHPSNPVRPYSSRKGVALWTWRDLNPRPLRCERNDLPLIYKPLWEYDLPFEGI